MNMIETDRARQPKRPGPAFAASINVDELVDEIALAARESSHGKAAYELLRRASGDTIPTLEGRLRLIDARNART